MSDARSSGGAATRRSDYTLVGLVVALGIYNVVRSTLLEGNVDTAANIAVGAGVFVVGRWSGLSNGELGLDGTRLGAGLRLGLLAAAVVAVVVIGGAVLVSADGDIDDGRVEISFPEMLLRVLVIIPIATALVEEVIFRGVLHGLLRRRFTLLVATAIGAVLFGLWHVYPAWLAEGDTAAGAGRWAPVVGTFLATATAGVAFTWLRERSGHLIAPILAHTATNSLSFAAGWFVVHSSAEAVG